MDSYRETFETWNKIASQYQEKFMYLNIYDATYDFFCNSVSKDKPTILEIGCGPGNITKYLLSKRPDFNIDAIDVAPNMIELAQKNNPSANFKVMDCRDIQTLATTYDGIICGFCLPYLSNAHSVKLILDSYILLTENGILYLSFVEGEPIKSGFQTSNSGDRVYFYYHNLEQLSQTLEEKGFEIPRVFKVNYDKSDKGSETHTIVLTRKKQ